MAHPAAALRRPDGRLPYVQTARHGAPGASGIGYTITAKPRIVWLTPPEARRARQHLSALARLRAATPDEVPRPQ